jgi:YYY domain-containing protein
LVMFGAQMLLHLWDRVAGYRPSLKHLVTAAILGLVVFTGLYAVAYISVYQQPHTAVRTSQWINQNAPRGSVILTEHWEEGIPDIGRYEVRTLPLYNDDVRQKLDALVTDLAEADYIVFFSNRLYGTIPRLPERYPFTTAYFRLLFGGGIGYELANVETAYPSVAGINFVDDTYGRAGIPDPDSRMTPSGLNVNLGFADESFSVYDHPKGIVFENVERLDESAIRERLVAATEGNTFATGGTPLVSTSGVGLMLADEDLQAQRSGGTWTGIVDPNGLGNRMPVPAWLLVMELMALAVLPIAFFALQSLPDGGYLLAKVLGILAVSLVAWLLASLQWMEFSSGAVMVGLGVVGSISGVVLVFTWSTFWAFVRERWRILAISEIIFLAAFIAFVAVRMANPDLWHPWLGGEKPMDTAYLNAVLKSTYMPPYDPWYGGGYINYYYWGQFIVASFIHMTGIDPVVAINLAVPMFFALTIGGAFSIVYNLAEGTRGKLLSKRAYVEPLEEIGPMEPVRPEPVEGRVPQNPSADSLTLSEVGGLTANSRKKFAWSPVLAGIVGALFVAVIGNIDGAIQVGEGLFDVLFQNDQFGQFDFWRSSRMMPPDPPGLEITEFPFFTFLFADLHAHLMVIPFTLLVIGASLAVVFSARDESRGSGVLARSGWGLSDIVLVAVLGVTVGALRLINTWDYPTYLLLGMAAVLLAEILRIGGLNFMVLTRAGVKGILIAVIGFVAFLPYHANYEIAFSSVESTTNQTVLWQFLAITGLFVFIIGSFFISEARGWLSAFWRPIWRRVSAFIQVSDQGEAPDAARSQSQQVSLLRLTAIALGVVLVGMVFVLKLVEVTGSTVPFAFVLVVLGAVVGLRHLFSARPDAPQIAFSVLLALTALSVVIGLDVYRVEGDIDRMNTIFKFYLQVWVMLALASAYMLWRLGRGRSVPIRKLPKGKKVWMSGLAVLVLCVSIYPFLGTQVRLRNRFDTTVPLTLDGAAYMQTEQEYFDPNGVIDLTADYEAIRWIQSNVEGSPLMLEGLTPNYRWGGRISIYTGLPNIVGWGWHQEQQRWNYRGTVNQRIDKVARIYNTPNPEEALDIMREYGVEYVYLGELERLYYEPTGLAKFADGFDGALEQVYANRDVRIFRVREG